MLSFYVYKFITGIYYIAKKYKRKFNFLQTKYLYVRTHGS